MKKVSLTVKEQPQKWWQKTSVYQIYPRSFADENGDGIGDLAGILNKLDYLQELGIETLWLSPIYQSPQRDHGYDISDYLSIAPEYGTLEEVDQLIHEVHRRGMKIAFDMVMNHTSNEHPWFQESKQSVDSPKRDWYIWRDGKGSGPPNNWSSFISHEGWQYDKTTQQWYCASFFPFQPDLNYENPEVKRAMLDVLRFWLKRGVDGFRLDIFHAIHKDPALQDNPFRPKYFPTEDDDDGFFQSRIHTVNHPKNFLFAKEVRAVLDEFEGERFAIGEVTGPPAVLRQYLGDKHDGLNLVFMFESLRFRFEANWFRRWIGKIEREFPAPLVPTYVFGNHDRMRVMKKLGNDVEKAKVLALLQLTARGVPVVYYGDEIGMKNADVTFKEASDPMAKMYSWLPQRLSDRAGLSDLIVRERARTPMQWSGEPQAGFCSPNAVPWVPVQPDFQTVNVERQLADPSSLLRVYKTLLSLRRNSPLWQEGSLELLAPRTLPPDVLGYFRVHEGRRMLVLLNFGEDTRTFHNDTSCQQLVFTTVQGQDGSKGGRLDPRRSFRRTSRRKRALERVRALLHRLRAGELFLPGASSQLETLQLAGRSGMILSDR